MRKRGSRRLEDGFSLYQDSFVVLVLPVWRTKNRIPRKMYVLAAQTLGQFSVFFAHLAEESNWSIGLHFNVPSHFVSLKLCHLFGPICTVSGFICLLSFWVCSKEVGCTKTAAGIAPPFLL